MIDTGMFNYDDRDRLQSTNSIIWSELHQYKCEIQGEDEKNEMSASKVLDQQDSHSEATCDCWINLHAISTPL
ncbi:predicted protein [Botrytis cinerea T4]|uniref:Uncharacterized protein n=1 Tax=Botryotinia fuckeliana (strain T4) TaxID=999810 RepID=G2YKA8_BOTF4|nr:predicted protein [Botrytis cinerea T4]